MLIFSLIWIALGVWGSYIIIKSEIEFDDGYWKNITYYELLSTIKWIIFGPVTLFLIVKWMFSEEDLGNKKVFNGKKDDTNTKV